MSDKIEPALSAHEWRVMRRERDDESMQAYLSHDGRQVVLPCDGDATGATTPGERHALAALALHGQSYGFTWDDVDRCRRAADRAEAEHDDPDGEMYMELAAHEEAEAWNNLADRIASLLPPREET